jgi:predicted dehydrogenase
MLTVLRAGAYRVLVEKPAAISIVELLANEKTLEPFFDKVFVAYNRRFYASVIEAQKLIEEDGGIISGNFEFTEWSHVIQDLKVSDNIKKNYFLANSSHVLDLAFYLMGKPIDLSSFVDGDCGWHKPSVFAGSGVTDRNVLFSYSANWESAGRWGIELLTAKRKLVLRPMEKLFEQKLGELTVNEVNVNEALIDDKYKPGVFKEVQAFLSEGSDSPLKTLDEQVQDINWLNQILNGKKDSM